MTKPFFYFEPEITDPLAGALNIRENIFFNISIANFRYFRLEIEKWRVSIFTTIQYLHIVNKDYPKMRKTNEA